MKYLSTAMYTGVFTIAYSTFIYQHYSAAAHPHPTPLVTTAVVQTPITNSRSVSSHSLSAVIQTNASLRSAGNNPGTQLVASNQIKTAYSRADSSRKTEVTASKHFVDNDTSEQSFDNHHQAENRTTFASTTSGSVRLQNIADAGRPTPSSYIASNKVATSITGSASATDSTSESNSIKATSSSAQTNIPGSEFLPNGKSQEDLYNSKLGQPHTYSISDYQKASINCELTSGNTANTSGSFNDLLHQLKGC